MDSEFRFMLGNGGKVKKYYRLTVVEILTEALAGGESKQLPPCAVDEVKFSHAGLGN